LAHGIPARLTPAEGRKFGLTVGAAFAVLGAITWWREHPILMYAFGGLASALVLAGLLVPGRMGPVYRAWMGLAHAISRVTTPIFMGVVFFGVIMPAGLLMRLLGRNPIKHSPVNQSYWAARSEARGAMTNQF
jgi:hypothetical protein